MDDFSLKSLKFFGCEILCCQACDLTAIFLFPAKMSDENWDEDAAVGATDLAAAQTAEMPEVKLFGRWSCDDVQVSDMSLQV